MRRWPLVVASWQKVRLGTRLAQSELCRRYRAALLVVCAVGGGCAPHRTAVGAEPDSLPPGVTPTTRGVGIRTVREGIPACEPGHEGALADGVVTIRPGETICLAVEVRGESVTPLAAVAPREPQGVVVLRFWQERGTEQMYLSVHNPLETALLYEATMLLPGDTSGQHTSTCPVGAKVVGIEQWPHRIARLRLTRFQTMAWTKPLPCR
jgi:hypothetical protein